MYILHLPSPHQFFRFCVIAYLSHMLTFLNINNMYQLLGHTKDPCGQSSLVNHVGMLFTNKYARKWC